MALTLSCGLLAVPIQTFTGTDPQTPIARTGFRKVLVEKADEPGEFEALYHSKRTGWPVDVATGEAFDPGEVVYMAQAANGEWVELADSEMKEVVGEVEGGLAEVVGFVPRDALLRDYVVVKWDQARPAKRRVGKRSEPDAGAEKAFALLCEGMRLEDKVALVRAEGKWYVLTPDGWWLRLAYSQTVRPPQPLAHPQLAAAELNMAQALVAAMTPEELPEPRDEAGPKLHDFVQAKATGEEVVFQPPQPAAQVVDIMAALEASIAAAQEARAS